MKSKNSMVARRKYFWVLAAFFLIGVGLLWSVPSAEAAGKNTCGDRRMSDGFIYFHFVERVGPPIGWRASFFYVNDAGLVQAGKEIGDSLIYQEWTSSNLWKRLVGEVPFDDLSDPLKPQPRPIRATTGNEPQAMLFWASVPDVGVGGWAGSVQQAEGRIQNFYNMLAVTLETPDHAVCNNTDGDVLGYIRCSWLAAETASELKKADLFVDLPDEGLGRELVEAIEYPFKLVPVQRDATPFAPWRSGVRWGRTAIESFVQDRPVQIRSWAHRELGPNLPRSIMAE